MMAVWTSNTNFNDTGIDFDIFCSFSLDGGTTWDYPQLVNTDGRSDVADDVRPDATFVNGTWLVAWSTAISEGFDTRVAQFPFSPPIAFCANRVDTGDFQQEIIPSSFQIHSSIEVGMTSNGLMLAVWSILKDYTPGLKKVQFAESISFGMNWRASSPLVLGSDPSITTNPVGGALSAYVVDDRISFMEFSNTGYRYVYTSGDSFFILKRIPISPFHS